MNLDYNLSRLGRNIHLAGGFGGVSCDDIEVEYWVIKSPKTGKNRQKLRKIAESITQLRPTIPR